MKASPEAAAARRRPRKERVCAHRRRYWDDGWCRCRKVFVGPCSSCGRTTTHHHCGECGATDHGAAYCDNLG